MAALAFPLGLALSVAWFCIGVLVGASGVGPLLADDLRASVTAVELDVAQLRARERLRDEGIRPSLPLHP